MDFSNRNVQHVQPSAAAPSAPTSAAGTPSVPVSSNRNKSSNRHEDSKWTRIAFVTMVAAIVVLMCAVIALTNTGNKSAPESEYVDNTKLQAVFLNTGQVYFGNVTSLNSKYFVLNNIYYLQTANTGAEANAANANTSVSLVKLGCELHQPDDQMVINRDQVTFWENLHESGQVAKAVATFKKQNPDGQKCVDQSSAAGTDSSNSAQPAGTSNSNSSNTNNNNSNNNDN